MSDLTEFLLARIAEDKAADMGIPHPDYCRQFGGWPGDPSSVVACDCGVSAWALAVCEAHRRIVEFRSAIGLPTDGSVREGEGMTYLDGAHAAVAAERERIMRILATVYADHPDYEATWAP